MRVFFACLQTWDAGRLGRGSLEQVARLAMQYGQSFRAFEHDVLSLGLAVCEIGRLSGAIRQCTEGCLWTCWIALLALPRQLPAIDSVARLGVASDARYHPRSPSPSGTCGLKMDFTQLLINLTEHNDSNRSDLIDVTITRSTEQEEASLISTIVNIFVENTATLEGNNKDQGDETTQTFENIVAASVSILLIQECRSLTYLRLQTVVPVGACPSCGICAYSRAGTLTQFRGA